MQNIENAHRILLGKYFLGITPEIVETVYVLFRLKFWWANTGSRFRGRQKSAKTSKDIRQTPASRTGNWLGELGQREASFELEEDTVTMGNMMLYSIRDLGKQQRYGRR